MAHAQAGRSGSGDSLTLLDRPETFRPALECPALRGPATNNAPALARIHSPSRAWLSYGALCVHNGQVRFTASRLALV
jgi:hypothetical protein